MEQLYKGFENLVQSNWFTAIIAAIIIIAITAIVAHFVRVGMLRLLHHNEGKALPESSIFVNIARIAVWILGICIMLSACFNVNVGAAIAALGVTGIAVSLGFQDTISNLIAGLEVSLMRIVEPGDNIQVGTSVGVVEDVTWRHTTIRDAAGEEIIIPNSSINTTALIHLPPASKVKLPLVVDTDGQHLGELATEIESAAKEAVSAITELAEEPKLAFSEVIYGGFKGTLSFVVADETATGSASDAAIRAIAPFMRKSFEE